MDYRRKILQIILIADIVVLYVYLEMVNKRGSMVNGRFEEKWIGRVRREGGREGEFGNVFLDDWNVVYKKSVEIDELF